MKIIDMEVEQILLISDEIEIVMLKVGENTVSIGIKAPKDVKVLRCEAKKTGK